MNTICKTLNAGLVSLSFFVTNAGAEVCSLGETTKIYFVNGVWNTLTQARDSMNYIKEAYLQVLETQYEGQKFEFGVSYNNHASKVQDMIEVIGQKRNEIADPEASDYTAEDYYVMYMLAKDFDERAPLVAQPISSAIEEYQAARLSDAVDAASHIQMYRSDLLEGKRVLLIAHSQGNMFATQAIAALMGEYPSSIAMIGVASPAAVVYNNSPYYTAHDDRVIDALRLINDVLPSNVDNDPGVFNDNRDSSNHQFIPSYMSPELVSRGLIDSDVDYFMSVLQFPTQLAGDGIITVTLEWGSEPDVDLHVFEPNGTQVFYSNRNGLSGYLDVDDVDSYGPEHYFVSCDTLETGIYGVGVNYYSGSGPETARVQIEAGSVVRSFTVPLGTAVGSSGNSTPISVADIVVTGDDVQGYSFVVQ